MESEQVCTMLSAIVASYKPEDYIWKCIDSLANQTLGAELYEIVIVLNGPKNPYYSNIAQYVREKRISNLKLIYSDKSGVSNARNTGIDESKGSYLLFIDDDDYVCSRYFESLLTKADESALVISDNEYFEDKTNKVLENPRSCYYKHNLDTKNILKFRRFYRVAWGKLIPRKIIADTLFDTNIQPGEDTLFIMEILARVREIKTIQGGCYYYRRIRANSLIAPRKSFADHWLLHSHQVIMHLRIIAESSNLRHKLIVASSMLGIIRYFVKQSLRMLVK